MRRALKGPVFYIYRVDTIKGLLYNDYNLAKERLIDLNKYIVSVNGQKFDIEITELDSRVVASNAPVAAPAPAAPVAAPAAAPAPAAAGSAQVVCPMPGTILDVKVSAGQAVTKGQVLLILEAMKMENEIVAPQDGTVAGVRVTKGAAVNSGDILVDLA